MKILAWRTTGVKMRGCSCDKYVLQGGYTQALTFGVEVAEAVSREDSGSFP